MSCCLAHLSETILHKINTFPRPYLRKRPQFRSMDCFHELENMGTISSYEVLEENAGTCNLTTGTI
jgi:hypothetical protein